VYTHPIDAPCWQDIMPGANPTTLEFPADTSRTILSLLLTNAAARNADTRFIFSHAAPCLLSWAGLGIAGARRAHRRARAVGQA